MKKTLTGVFLFILSWITGLSQNKLEVQFFSRQTRQAVEYALVYNTFNKKFSFSDLQGKAVIEYTSASDSVLVKNPGYTNKTVRISDILAQENKVYLDVQIQELKEVEIIAQMPVYTCKEIVKGKKNRITKIAVQGASIVSSLKPACTDCLLKVIVFDVDPTSLLPGGNTYLRPILYRTDRDGKPVSGDLIKTSSAIHAETSHKDGKIMIDVSPFHIALDKDSHYMIGFQLMSFDQKGKEVAFRSSKDKDRYSLVSGRPESGWGRLDGLSLGYELYFSR